MDVGSPSYRSTLDALGGCRAGAIAHGQDG